MIGYHFEDLVDALEYILLMMLMENTHLVKVVHTDLGVGTLIDIGLPLVWEDSKEYVLEVEVPTVSVEHVAVVPP